MTPSHTRRAIFQQALALSCLVSASGAKLTSTPYAITSPNGRVRAILEVDQAGRVGRLCVTLYGSHLLNVERLSLVINDDRAICVGTGGAQPQWSEGRDSYKLL